MVISVADAYALGPDGQVDMDLFRQFADQQAIANASVAPGGSNAPSLTQGQQYLAANPDVLANAQMRAQEAGLSSGNEYSNYLDQVAREHFDAWGQTEGRSGFGFTAPPGGNTGGASSNPTSTAGLPGFAQPTFDTSQYDTAFQNALGNFNGLLDNYNSFFGDMLTNATNAQNQMPQYGGGFLPFATTLMPGGGSYQTTYNPFNTTTGSSFGGTFGSNSSFGSGSGIGSMAGQAANSSHRQWFTL